MKTVDVPKFFHEVFGKRPTVIELVLTLAFGIGMSLLELACTHLEWSGLEAWRLLLLMVIVLDINCGIVANFTFSTNAHYKASPAARLIFIAIHVHPLLLALAFGGYWTACLYTWGYTIAAGLFVNVLISHPAQRTVAAASACFGVGMLILLFAGIPKLLLITLVFFNLKVVYGFAVDHYAGRRD
jgi:hypothetical protein